MRSRRPSVNISVNDTLLLGNRIFIGGPFARLVSVWLPVLPEGAGTVVITPACNGGCSTKVIFTPTAATLTSATPLVWFNVTATTTSATGEYISFTFTGTATAYFPQPLSLQYPISFWSRGTFTVGGIPSSIFRTTSQPIAITISYVPPAGYPSITVNVVPADGSISASPPSVQWGAGDTNTELAVSLTA